MAEKKGFEYTKRDSQGTAVAPITPEQFDFQAYHEYELSLAERQQKFLQSDSGLLVYRRVRADGVFYDKCRNMKESLALQLGALQKSLEYKADIANFLEPWYGIGYIAGSFGGSYEFPANQSPVVRPMFESIADMLEVDPIPLDQTPMGKHILEMTEYFMDQTKGLVPVSLTDVQSPINMMSYLMPVDELFYELYDDPEGVQQAANLVGDLLLEFLNKQRAIIGDALASPGHGFASSRIFKGIGLSDDNSIMISDDHYRECFLPADEKLGQAFNGLVFHSCGNWENKIKLVKNMKGIIMADGAFTLQTDPAPNDPAVFAKGFGGSGLILNARAVGPDAEDTFRTLRQPDMKLIAVTYCESAEEQAKLYDILHGLV